MVLLLIFAFGFLISTSVGQKCPHGGEIFASGISNEAKVLIVDMHNEFRLRLARNELKQFPQATNMASIKYDETLGELAKKVTATCQLQSMQIKDNRYGELGMNIYKMSSNTKSGDEKWAKPLEAWFRENTKYTYSKITDSTEGGAFTQLIWAKSTLVGCDYIYYYDSESPLYPYTQLYTCLYAPAGNIIGQFPYDNSGPNRCENLCNV